MAEPTSEGPIIRMSDVRRSFVSHGQTVDVLRGVDLEVRQGEALGVEGRSGSGKSTLLSILGLIDDGYTGGYAFEGAPVASMDEAARNRLRLRRLGVAFQDLWLVDSLTTRENLLVPLLAAGREMVAANERANELLDAAGIKHRADVRPPLLSGGERRRAALARALVNRPDVLLVDEPTAELDAEAAEGIVALIREAQTGGVTLVAASHDARVLALCRRRVRLMDGRALEGAT